MTNKQIEEKQKDIISDLDDDIEEISQENKDNNQQKPNQPIRDSLYGNIDVSVKTMDKVILGLFILLGFFVLIGVIL